MPAEVVQNLYVNYGILGCVVVAFFILLWWVVKPSKERADKLYGVIETLSKALPEIRKNLEEIKDKLFDDQAVNPMDVDTKLDMVKDPTSGTDNYISQFVFESCEMRHEKREKRYFSIIVLLIVLLVATNVAWLFYEAQFQVQTSETVTTTTTQTVDATQETANGDASLDVTAGGD